MLFVIVTRGIIRKDMKLPPRWKYINKGLTILLTALFLATIASVLYLSNTLLNLRSLISQGGSAVGSVIITQDLLIDLQDAETGQRGYIITGDTTYLTPYKSALQRIPVDIKMINNSSGGGLSAAQSKQLNDLTNAKLRELDQTLKLRSAGGFDTAAAAVSSNDGNNLMQQLRVAVTQISAEKLRGIGPRERQSQTHLRQALVVAALLSIFVFSMCVSIIWYFQRAILKERALESTKSEFLSLASHQLRTPATNVKQYVGMLLDGYMGRLTRKQRGALEVAYKNNEFEINIMNSLLDVAKLDLDRISLKAQAVDLVPLTQQVLVSYAAIAAERGQTIEFESPLQLVARVDSQYFKSIIENLVDNAIKYSGSATTILITLLTENGQLRLSVADQGTGIRRRDFNKLFMKFSRLQNDYSATTAGSGLGLYWVRQIVKLHGGTVAVSSKSSKGTTFTVKLPGS